MTTKNPIEDVLTHILAASDARAVEAAVGLEGTTLLECACTALEAADPTKFQQALLYPLQKIAMGVLIPQLGSNWKARFLFLHSDFVGAHIRRLIESEEGMACCADKTRTILRALGRHLVKGTPIEFNYNQEYTFHLPSKVLHTQESILEFFDAIQHLHSGRVEPYLAILLRLKNLNTSSNPS